MRNEIKKLALASILTALSILIDVAVKIILPFDFFGLPLYAIPLIIGSFILGPFYGIAMGFVSDFIGFQMTGIGTYGILFGLSAIMWGAIPCIFANERSKPLRLMIAILITHILATTSNTLALWMMYSKETAFANILLRVLMLPINVAVLTVIIYLMNRRIKDFYVSYQQKDD